MYTIFFFMSFDGDYADSLHSTECDFRPSVGDIFYIGDSMLGTSALELEKIIYVGNNIFHTYCEDIKPNNSHPPYYGIRGKKDTLVAHTEDQIGDHPHLYKNKSD